MIIQKIVADNGYQTNIYVIADEKTKKCAVIDPGGSLNQINKFVKDNSLSVEYIILTHGHGDHIGVLTLLKELTNAKVIAHEKEKEMLNTAKYNLSSTMRYGKVEIDADIYIKDQDTLMLGESKLKFIHTPGHTLGGICIKHENHLFTGDTLFAGSIGRCDLFGGDMKTMNKTLAKLKKQPDEIAIYPGHGPHSTMKIEKMTNPYMEV